MKQDAVLQELTDLKQLLQRDERPLSFTEASEYLGVSKSHLYKMTYKNLIVHFKPNGKKIYFTKADLNKYLLRNRKADRSELEQIAVDKVCGAA